MVTRTYICPECGTFEKMSSIKDEPLRECPECGKELKRKFYNPNVLWCEVNKNRYSPINPQSQQPIFNND